MNNLWIIKSGDRTLGDQPLRGTREQAEAYRDIVYDESCTVEPMDCVELNDIRFDVWHSNRSIIDIIYLANNKLASFSYENGEFIILDEDTQQFDSAIDVSSLLMFPNFVKIYREFVNLNS